MNNFDAIQTSAFNVITTTFGYDATWTPSADRPMQTAKVLYQDDIEAHGLSEMDYNTERYEMEYAAGHFVGLREALAQSGQERVKIQTKPATELEFMVRRVESKYDGKTFIAHLTPLDL